MGSAASSQLAWLTAAALLGEDWRAGAAFTHSWGNGSYEADKNADNGDIAATMTGVFPYGSYGLTPRPGIWGAVGYG